MKSFLPLLVLSLGLISFSDVRGDETWDGGNGTWDLDNTAHWNSGQVWTGGSQQAAFQNAAGTVDVDTSHGAVTFRNLAFSGGSGWLVQGGEIDSVGDQYGLIDDNSGDAAITSNIVVDTTGNADRYYISDNVGAALKIGNLTFGDQGSGHASLIVNGNNPSAQIYLNGTIKNVGQTNLVMNLRIGENDVQNSQAHYYINGDISGLGGVNQQIEMFSGNVVVSNTANLGTQNFFIGDSNGRTDVNESVLATGGATISNFFYISGKYAADPSLPESIRPSLGAGDASSVTFTGPIGLDNSNLALFAADKGRATFSGDFFGHPPGGITKTGTGTVVISTPKSYSLQDDNVGHQTAVAMDVQAGTLLITNTSGTAFGGGNSGIVNVENNATLGGSGISTQKIVTGGSNTVVAPGDSGADYGTSSIATLHLNGGMDASNGLTMNFKLNGENNDSIDFAEALLTLNGTVTINLTGTPTPDTGTGNYGVFTLLTNIGTGSTSHGVSTDTLGENFSNDPSFIINAPMGYAVESAGFASNFDTPGTFYFVQLQATPEPSTYGLMGLGLLALVAVRRFRRLSA